ncbi:MAG: homoserine O-acetyltransferase [Bacteroidota bacterium]
MNEGSLLIDQFPLESGGCLTNAEVHYRWRGNLHHQPVVWVFHALTANDNPEEWWFGLFGSSGIYGENYAVVCVNVLGSPYGSASPVRGNLRGMDFPAVTVRDTVRAQFAVAAELGINKIHTLIGGSFGGYQALEFAYGFRGTVDHLILLATGAEEKPWNKAIHEAQRLAMIADPTLAEGDGAVGLKAARGIGMLNYRTPEQYNSSQKDDPESLGESRAASYIRYQGQKLVDRFDAAAYFKLTQQLDTHNLGRGRGGLAEALGGVMVPTLVMAIDSDALIPPAVQEELHQFLPNSTFRLLKSAFGHDGFLLEFEQITKHILDFYND